MTGRPLIIFDMDGTLVDSQHVIIAAMRGAYAAFGAPAPGDDAVRRIIGLSLPEAFARLSPDAGPADNARLTRLYKDSYLALREAGADDAPLFPGARAALDRLAPANALSVATGKARRGLDHVVKVHGLAGVFTHSQTADDAPSKPHPAMVAQCVAAHGAAPERAVMVGDTAFDMAMARAAGARALGVSWGYHPADELIAAGAEAVIHAFDEIDAAAAALLESR